MKLSIITINLNNAIGLDKTINSVINQYYNDFEYIVIDGDSIDGSKQIIDKYKEHFAYLISEPDTGIYNAMNKGIKVATGEYLLFLNSGDVLINSQVLGDVTKLNLDRDIVYGNIHLESGKKQEICLPTDDLTFKFLFRCSLPHQATFIKRTVFERVGFYDEKLKIVSDWKLLLLAICKHNCSYKHIETVVSVYNDDGISSNPANSNLIKQERKSVFLNYFPLFIKDYEKMIFLDREMRRFKNLIKARWYFKTLFDFKGKYKHLSS
ncbi:MAG: glycosyltransferase family 2 protein [Daejeonella sp.]